MSPKTETEPATKHSKMPISCAELTYNASQRPSKGYKGSLTLSNAYKPILRNLGHVILLGDNDQADRQEYVFEKALQVSLSEHEKQKCKLIVAYCRLQGLGFSGARYYDDYEGYLQKSSICLTISIKSVNHFSANAPIVGEFGEYLQRNQQLADIEKRKGENQRVKIVCNLFLRNDLRVVENFNKTVGYSTR